MRPESAWLYHFRQLVTDPEFLAWIVALGSAAGMTAAITLMLP